MKTVLNISDVFNEITPTVGFKSTITLSTGQKVRMNPSLITLSKFKDLTCSECGCNGTHLEYSEIGNPGEKHWRIMSYSKKFNSVVFLNRDHIIPKASGGTLLLKNVRVTCNLCNNIRGSKLLKTNKPKIKVLNIYKVKDVIIDFFSRIQKFKTVKKLVNECIRQIQRKLDKMNIMLSCVPIDVLFRILPEMMQSVELTLTQELKLKIKDTAIMV